MEMNLQHNKLTYGAPLTAIAVSAMLLMGSASGANAWHYGKAHGVGGLLGGAIVGGAIGGAVKGKKGILPGAAIGAVVGGVAAGSRARPAPRPRPRAYYPPAPVYGRGLVYDIQASLSRLGYSPGPLDGVYGQLTADAIGSFQYNSQLPVTGRPPVALLSQSNQAAAQPASPVSVNRLPEKLYA